MIVTCTCGVRLKVSDDKVTEAGVKVRCPKCGTLHVAKKPGTPATDGPPVHAAAPRDAAGAGTAPSMPWFASSAPSAAAALVVIAHDSRAVAGMIDGILRERGMQTDYAANGLEALKMASERRPQAMIVDVGLTGIYGFELCERLKDDPDTRNIKIILLSSVYGLSAYKRAPIALYGADDYIEKHHLSDQLIPKLLRLIAPGDERPAAAPPAAAPSAPPPAPEPGPAGGGPETPDIPSVLPKVPVTLGLSRKRRHEDLTAAEGSLPPPAPPARERTPPEAPLPGPGPALPHPGPAVPARPELRDESIWLNADFFEQLEYEAPRKEASRAVADPAEVEKAKRFARIIVSDIALYNEEAVVEGIRKGTLFDLLKDDIAEGRALYERRVPEGVRAEGDYLQQAFDEFIASKKKLR